MNFVIGDIHGELKKLKILIKYIQASDNSCKLIFVGDYLDKGNSSKLVLDYLLTLDESLDCVFLTGNHEFYWMKESLGSENYLLKYGGKKTIKSFNSKSINDTKKILKTKYEVFFNKLKPYYFTENYFICHSGFNPLNHDREINDLPIEDFLFNRYKFIQSKILFKNKYKVIFGHTAFYTPYVDSYKIGIDTGACFLKEQPLTAYCLEKEFFLNSNNIYTDLSRMSDLTCPIIIRSNSWQKK